MDSEALKDFFRDYGHHVYFILFFVVAGFIIHAIIKKVINSIPQSSQRTAVKTTGGTMGFFPLIGQIFSYTISLYIGCEIFYTRILRDEISDFLLAVIKIESVIILMLILSSGINHILKKIYMSKSTASENNPLSTGKIKKNINTPVINALAWILAFFACSMVLNDVLISSMFKYLLVIAALLYAPIFLYRSSEPGHQLITGLIGYFYLKDEQKNNDTGQPLMLRVEDGRLLEVKKISLLHTSFKTESGAIEIRHNSLLMVTNFGFKKFKSKPERASQDNSSNVKKDGEVKRDIGSESTL